MRPESCDCFLSYSSLDADIARQIHTRLTDAGLTVWWDKIYLTPGMQWHREIERHCEAARIVLPILTPNWKQSLWTRYETYGAENIIPLLHTGPWHDVSTPPLQRFQNLAINLQDPDWDKLIATIRAICAIPRPDNRQLRTAHLRHGITPHFVGRDELLTSLHEKLFQNPTTAITNRHHVQAVTALGGVGKTTIARQYAETFWRAYRQMFWVDCRNGIENGFAEICDAMDPSFLKSGIPVPQRAAIALRELKRIDPNDPNAPERLLILDDAPDQDTVAPWIPHTGHCHTLITSRFTAWSKEIETCPVWVLDPEPARQLLLKRSGRETIPGEETPADKVAQKLEYLPLALEQAAAYVEQQERIFGFTDYLRLYEQDEKHFLDTREPGTTDYAHSVYMTWRATTAKLPEGARAMLRLHAFFAPTPFPMDLYVKSGESLKAELSIDEAPGELQIRAWRKALVDYSMARNEDDNCISVHSLVQAVERHELGDRKPEVAQRAADLYWKAAPSPTFDVQSQALWRKLVSHSKALAENPQVSAVLQSRLYAEIASAFHYTGSYTKGAEAARLALDLSDRLLGPDHPSTLTVANNLAYLLKSNGDYEQAEPLFRRTLEACERVLGPEHPDSLASVNNLAVLLESTGAYEEAESLFRRAAEVSKRTLGPEHPHTLKSLTGLACLLRCTGLYEQSEALHRQALRSMEQALGSDHPDTLSSVSALATALESAGNFTDAEPLFRRALEARERILGPEHPDTLAALNNLASLLESKGEYEQAEPLYRRALETTERVLGHEHPYTLALVNNVGGLLESQRDYEKAEPLYRRALEARERVLGPEHPDTLTSVNNLAYLLKSKGDSDQAERLYRRALEASDRVLGPDHPDTLTVVNNLALLLHDQGEYQRADPLFRLALGARERVLGSEHPATLTSVNNLALLLGNKGDYEKAEPLNRRAAEGARNTLGPDHPLTRTLEANYAQLLKLIRQNRTWRARLRRLFTRRP